MSIESEAFLLGIWTNFQELEETLSLPELQAILTAARKKEEHAQKFAAALKGIKLDEEKHENQERFEAVKARASARLAGKNADEAEFEVYGIDFITE